MSFKSKFAVLLIAVVALVLFQPAAAQSDPCSYLAVIDSFRAAVMSDSVSTWVDNYEKGSCQPKVIQSVRLMERSYEIYTKESNSAAIPLYWGNGTAQQGGTTYTNVGMDIAFTSKSQFDGTLRLTSSQGTYVVSVRGEYVEPSSAIADSSPFNMVDFVGCNRERIVGWLRWNPVEKISGGSFNTQRLYVAAITDDNRLCFSVLATPQGGDLVYFGTMQAVDSQ